MSDYERGYKQGVEDAHRCEQRHAQIDQLEADVRALRDENARLKAAICDIWNGHGLCEDHGQLGYWKLGKYIDLAIALQPERGRND